MEFIQRPDDAVELHFVIDCDASQDAVASQKDGGLGLSGQSKGKAILPCQDGKLWK